MIINVDVLKKIDGAIARGKPLSLDEIGGECGLDSEMLALVAGDLSQKVSCMDLFFDVMQSYLVEMDKRVKKMSKQYKVIQNMQIMNGTIEATSVRPNPPIRWKCE